MSILLVSYTGGERIHTEATRKAKSGYFGIANHTNFREWGREVFTTATLEEVRVTTERGIFDKKRGQMGYSLNVSRAVCLIRRTKDPLISF